MRAVAVGGPAAVGVARFGGIVPLRNVAGNIFLARLTVLARGKAFRNAVGSHGGNVVFILMVGHVHFAVSSMADVADLAVHAVGGTAGAVVRDGVVCHGRFAAGTGFGVRAVAVGGPAAVGVARFGGIVPLRNVAGNIFLARLTVLARGKAFRNAVGSHGGNVVFILMVGHVHFAVSSMADVADLAVHAVGGAAGAVVGDGVVFHRRFAAGAGL